MQFADLGPVVIDEQHRFGVSSVQHSPPSRLPGLGHVLVTATPIPRTVAITVFGDLDVSVLRELPTGRRQSRPMSCPRSRSPVTWSARGNGCAKRWSRAAGVRRVPADHKCRVKLSRP